VVEYPTGSRGTFQAVSDVSFDIKHGETLGLVGESGCGKSSVARATLQLPSPASGSVMIDGVELTRLKPRALRRARRKAQVVFQDPISSLNPFRKVGRIVTEGLAIAGHPRRERDAIARRLLDTVGLDSATFFGRRPRELSGGQCQRVSIARALALEPSLMVCDEVVSALDVSVQAQVLNLLQDMKERYGLALLFIAHDLAVVKNVSDRIAVMYLGRLCEVGPSEDVCAAPLHPYTQGLLSSVEEPDPDVPRLPFDALGEPASPANPPSGCRFRTRCPLAQERCAEEVPEMREMSSGRFVACHFPLTPVNDQRSELVTA
jgi:peptide/nickel transport system ATP-binding protein